MSGISFPVRLRAVFVGQAGSSGSFQDPETGEKINYSEAYAFDFDDPEGNVQRLQLRGSKIVEVSDVDPVKLKRYVDQVDIEGLIVLSQGSGGRSFFRPVKIQRVGAAS